MTGGAPTLGTELLYWIEDEAELVHGAGTVQGERVRWLPPAAGEAPLDCERCAIFQSAYELHPSPVCESCGRWNDVEAWDYRHKRAGVWCGWVCPTPKCGQPLPPVRSWKHYKLSRPKGWSKSGIASKFVACEAVGPVEFDGWGHDGEPVGRPRRAPVIRCYATEEGQADHTFKPAAYMLRVLGESSWARTRGVEIDVGVDEGQKSTLVYIRTEYGTHGRVEPRTSSGSAAAGGQTTFAPVDETWRWVGRQMHDLYNNEVLNVAKSNSPGWVLETTTYPEPGRGSVAELTLDDGAMEPPFGRKVDHRGFRNLDWLLDADTRDIDIEKFAEECRHAYGSATWAYSLPARLAEFRDPTLDLASLIRQFGNAAADTADRYISRVRWDDCRADGLAPDWQPNDGEWVTTGFDGSLTDDHTGLIGFHVPTATLFVIGHWDPADTPTEDHPDGQVDEQDVDLTVRSTMGRWWVPRAYKDPPHWRSWIAAWQRKFGKQVKPFETKSQQRMTGALRAFREAVQTGQLRHTGHPILTKHMLNAVLITDAAKVKDPDLYPDGRVWRLSKPTKTKHDPDNKIDLGVCAVLAYVAGLDSQAAGEEPPRRKTGTVKRLR